jgi:Flp pilus assembly protein protease CpaA
MIPILSYAPVILILLAIPYFCWSDIRTREVDPKYIALVALLSIPSLIMYLSESPDRNYYLFGLSIGLCIIPFIIALVGGIGGADFWFIMTIMIFVQYNPFKFPRVFFPLDFLWTLLVTMVYMVVILYAINLYHKRNKEEILHEGGITVHQTPYTLVEMFTKYPNGIPFMVPISFAFVATLVMEMFI